MTTHTLPVTCRGHDFLVTFESDFTPADPSTDWPEQDEIYIKAVTLVNHPDIDLTQLALDFFHDDLVTSIKHQHRK